MKSLEQIGFSSILFDTLFGLVLFFGLDSFLEINSTLHFIFYLFSTIILVHWWLIFKSADDAFQDEVENSAVDLIFGIIYIILLEFIILQARAFNIMAAAGYLIALLAIDFSWALVWRYVGDWKTKNRDRIKRMETELDHNIIIDAFSIILFIVLVVFLPQMPAAAAISLFIFLYVAHMFLTFRYKIIDLKIF